MLRKNLIKILEESCKKNGGDTPLTLGHLLNILKLEERISKSHYEAEELYEMQLLDEVLHSEHGDSN